MATVTPGVCALERIEAALKTVNVDLSSLEDVEGCDDYVANFDLKKASTRAYVEALEASLRGQQYSARESLVWELQRLGAMVVKIRRQRCQDEQEKPEDRHRRALEAMRGKIEAMEARLSGMHADIAGCEQILASAPPAAATGPPADEGPPPIPAGGGAGIADGVQVPPAAIPPGAQRGVLPPGNAKMARPQPPPIPGGAASLANASAPARAGGQILAGPGAVAQVPQVPPGGEGSDVDSNGENPWGDLQ